MPEKLSNDDHPVIPGLTASRRRWIYGLALASAPLAVIHGVVTGEDIGLYVAWAAAFLGSGVALPNINK